MYLLNLTMKYIYYVILTKPLLGLFVRSIDFLHSVGVNLLGGGVIKWWEIIILSFVILEDGETELYHSVNSGSEVLWLFKGESGGEEGGFVHQPDEILDGLIGLIDFSLVSELRDNLMVGVELEGLFGDHVR